MLDEEPKFGLVEASLELLALSLKNGLWNLKLGVNTALDSSYHQYSSSIEFDERPFEAEIEEYENELKGSLFEDDPGQKQQIRRNIDKTKARMEERRKACEKIEFSGTVSEVKYMDGKTVLALNIPDAVVEPISRQRFNLKHYKIALVPVF